MAAHNTKIRQQLWRKSLIYATSTCGIALLYSSTSFAQQTSAALTDAAPSAGSASSADIVVTAQRREEKSLSVPVSVSAVTGAALAQTGIRETRDITQVLPGVTFNDSGPNDTFAIRGVSLNDVGDSNESPIALYEDDVYVAALAGIQSEMFDVNRVEVLRGPQGTLFGRNATGGVVQLISNKPTADYSGDLSAQYGSFNQFILNGAFGGPLLDGRVRERTAFTYDRDDGWQHNVVTNTRTARANNWAARELVDVDVTSRLRAELNVHLGANDDVPAIYGTKGAYDAASGTFNPATLVATGNFCTQAQVIALAPQCTNFFGFRDPRPSPTTVYSTLADPPEKIRNYGASVNLNYDGGWFDLTSISAFEWTKKWYYEDGSPGPYVDYIDPWGATRAQLSQEVRASGDAGAAHWTTGVYYFTEHLTDGYWGEINAIPILGTYGDQSQFSELTAAGAVFGQVDYKITPTLIATAGVRYSQEWKKLDITDSIPNPTYSEEDMARAHDTTWKLALEWKFIPGWMTYGSISTGFKSPGFNTTGATAGGSSASLPERITTYEIGAKGSLWNDRLQLSSAIYYSDYQDFQLVDNVPNGLFAVDRLINVPLAHLYGAELDINAQPIRNLFIDVNGSLTESRIIAPGDNPDDLDGGNSLNGWYVANTPKQTLKASAEYRWNTPSIGRITPRINVDYQSDFAPNLSCQVTVSCIVPAYTLVNTNIEWTPPDGKYHVELFVNNTFDIKYQTGAYYNGDADVLIWGRPRLFGVKIFTHW